MPTISRERAKRTEPIARPNGRESRGRPLRVLFLHSDAAHVKRCVRELSAANLNVSADVVLTPEQFAERLSSSVYDIVVAEYTSSNSQRTAALEALQGMDNPVPLIFMIDQLPMETVAELITDGAVDCIAMEHVSHLPVTVRRALSENNCARSATVLRSIYDVQKRITAP
jgi:DNA-binding NtrC family response regulator